MTSAASRSARRRALLALGAAALLLTSGAASWWWFWVPHARPSLRPGEVYGIDVSHHQGAIDWRRVARDDVDFAYIKATEGADHVDRRFAENWRGAGEAGLRRGAYHFFTLCRPGRDQAENFLTTAPPAASDLPPAVDLELAGNCSARPSTNAVYAELDAFLTAVEAAWRRPVLLYVGADFESRYPVLHRSDRPRWLVSFFGRPERDWAVWQLHGRAKVQGVRGSVDLDVGRLGALDEAAAAALAGRASS